MDATMRACSAAILARSASAFACASALEAVLFFGLLALQFGLLALLDPAFFQSRIAKRNHRLADFADLVVPVGARHVEFEAAAGNLQQAVAQPIQRTQQDWR